MADEYQVIDIDQWNRKELYRLYTEEWTTCCHTFNVELDITRLVRFVKAKKIKLAAALIWLVSNELNKQSNFRMTLTNGELREWNVIHPRYPVLNANKNITFHCTRYSDDFSEFYAAYLEDFTKNADLTGAFAGTVPENSYSVSIVANVPFVGCTIDLKNPKGYYLPMAFVGKYFERKGRLITVCSLTVNHAVADGYHSGVFFQGLQKSIDCFGGEYGSDESKFA